MLKKGYQWYGNCDGQLGECFHRSTKLLTWCCYHSSVQSCQFYSCWFQNQQTTNKRCHHGSTCRNRVVVDDSVLRTENLPTVSTATTRGLFTSVCHCVLLISNRSVSTFIVYHFLFSLVSGGGIRKCGDLIVKESGWLSVEIPTVRVVDTAEVSTEF